MSLLLYLGGKGIANNHRKCLDQQGDQVTALYASPGILDIIYNTKTKNNNNLMSLYDSANPKLFIHEMA